MTLQIEITGREVHVDMTMQLTKLEDYLQSLCYQSHEQSLKTYAHCVEIKLYTSSETMELQRWRSHELAAADVEKMHIL